MARLLLALRYLGTRYHGWQVQPNAPTIQETVRTRWRASPVCVPA